MKTIILYANKYMKKEERIELENIYSEKSKANVVILDAIFEKQITTL